MGLAVARSQERAARAASDECRALGRWGALAGQSSFDSSYSTMKAISDNRCEQAHLSPKNPAALLLEVFLVPMPDLDERWDEVAFQVRGLTRGIEAQPCPEHTPGTLSQSGLRRHLRPPSARYRRRLPAGRGPWGGVRPSVGSTALAFIAWLAMLFR